MKRIGIVIRTSRSVFLRGLLLTLFALLVSACSSTNPSSDTEQVPASSTTQSRTTIKTWQISGTGVNVAVEGLDRSGKAVHSLESVKSDDGSVKADFVFRDAAGTELANRSFTIKASGEVLGIPIEEVDETLCPSCMGDDLKDASSMVIRLEPLQTVTAECRAARRALTAALTEVMNTCRRTPIAPIIDENACFQAQLDVISAQQAVQDACGS
jgi:hypothetical protein